LVVEEEEQLSVVGHSSSTEAAQQEYTSATSKFVDATLFTSFTSPLMKIFPVMNGGVGGIDDTITASDARAIRLFRIAAKIAAGDSHRGGECWRAVVYVLHTRRRAPPLAETATRDISH
jgi:hypothetical protein